MVEYTEKQVIDMLPFKVYIEEHDILALIKKNGCGVVAYNQIKGTFSTAIDMPNAVSLLNKEYWKIIDKEEIW